MHLWVVARRHEGVLTHQDVDEVHDGYEIHRPEAEVRSTAVWCGGFEG